MSRIGKVPVEIPSGVEVSLNGNVITAKGPKGTLDQEFSPLAEVEIADNVTVEVIRGTGVQSLMSSQEVKK